MTMKPGWGVLAAVALVFALAFLGLPAQAIDLNPFSAIKSAVEAAVGDRSSGDIAKDLEFKAKINALLLDGGGVNVTNFRWRSVGGRVFPFGRALSKPELDKAIGIVKGIKNVLSVKSRIKVRPKG